MGVVTARDHVSIAFESESLLHTASEFRDSRLSNQAVCEKLGIPEKKGWDPAKARALIRQEEDLNAFIKPIDYRPFDTRQIFYHRSLVWGMSWPTMQHVLDRDNLGISTTRSIETGTFQHVFTSRHLIGHHFVSLKEVNYFFPLWHFPKEGGLASRSERTPNLKPEFVRAVAARLDLRQPVAGKFPTGLTPEGIFDYIYAVFHSPNYRSRYAELLKMDFPRLPLPGSLDLFRDLAGIGGELVALHLLESPKLDPTLTTYAGPKNPEVERVGWSDQTVWLDAAATKKSQPATPGTVGFHGVPETVWNFRIGGYQVCEKWLKDRKGRVLADNDIAHYQKIVVALTETIRLMQEIDEVIEQHGGWPGAFAEREEKARPTDKVYLTDGSHASARPN
jgi:predicted helicase